MSLLPIYTSIYIYIYTVGASSSQLPSYIHSYWGTYHPRLFLYISLMLKHGTFHTQRLGLSSSRVVSLLGLFSSSIISLLGLFSFPIYGVVILPIISYVQYWGFIPSQLYFYTTYIKMDSHYIGASTFPINLTHR